MQGGQESLSEEVAVEGGEDGAFLQGDCPVQRSRGGSGQGVGGAGQRAA